MNWLKRKIFGFCVLVTLIVAYPIYSNVAEAYRGVKRITSLSPSKAVLVSSSGVEVEAKPSFVTVVRENVSGIVPQWISAPYVQVVRKHPQIPSVFFSAMLILAGIKIGRIGTTSKKKKNGKLYGQIDETERKRNLLQFEKKLREVESWDNNGLFPLVPAGRYYKNCLKLALQAGITKEEALEKIGSNINPLLKDETRLSSLPTCDLKGIQKFIKKHGL